MERPQTSRSSDAGAIVGAIALVVVGLVIFVPSGLCTGVFFLWQNGPHWSPNYIALVIGGPFVLGGGVLIWLGAKRLVDQFRK